MMHDGWTSDGRRIMIPFPNRMSKDCRYDLKRTDPNCSGCRWIEEVA